MEDQAAGGEGIVLRTCPLVGDTGLDVRPSCPKIVAKTLPKREGDTPATNTAQLPANTPEELRRVIDTTPAFLHSSDPDGSHGFFNQRWLEYVGASEAALQDWGWTAFIHPEDLPGMLAKWRACLDSGEVGQ